MKSFFESSGNVASLDVLTALRRIDLKGVSGTVRFTGAADEAVRYGFDAGILVALETPPAAAAPEVLIRAGKVQRATYETLTVGDFEDRFAVAAASGVISKREVSWGLKMSAIETLAWILSWTEGNYTFDEGVPAPTAPPLHLPVDQWILELFLRSTDRAFVLRKIGATDLPIARAPGFAEGFTALGLTADADAVVEAIDGKRSVEQIVKRSRADEFATLKLFAGLMTLGLVHSSLESPIGPRQTAAVEPEPDRADEIAAPPTGPSVSDAAEDVTLPPEAEAVAFPEGTTPDEDEAIGAGAAGEESLSEPPAETGAPSSQPEIVNLPLFALTAPELDSTEAEVEIVSATPPQEALREPAGGGKWLVTLLVLAIVAVAAMMLRRRASVSSPKARAISEVAPPRTESPPMPPSPAPPTLPPTASARSGVSPAPQIVVSRSPEVRNISTAGKSWGDLSKTGARTFEHPGAHRYAIQLELACEEGTLRKAFAADPSRRRIWLTPYPFRGRSCYRVLWGKFDDLASAKSAKKTIPALFSREGNRPAVIALGKASAGIAKENGNR